MAGIALKGQRDLCCHNAPQGVIERKVFLKENCKKWYIPHQCRK